MGLPIPEDKDAHFVPPPALPFNYLDGHIRTFFGSLRSFIIGYLLVYYVHGGEENYPAYGAAAEWNFQWMWPIMVRNLVLTWVICGGWDYILYFSSLAPAFKPYKICQDYPTFKQMKHDAFISSFATMFCAASIEIVICHYMATGYFKMT